MTSNETIENIRETLVELADSIERRRGVALLSVRFRRDESGNLQTATFAYEDRTEKHETETNQKQD